MPEESESPSGGWRAVYASMGVSTPTEPTDSDSDDLLDRYLTRRDKVKDTTN